MEKMYLARRGEAAGGAVLPSLAKSTPTASSSERERTAELEKASRSPTPNPSFDR